jgi:CubicO group peptidase (beta-lactamase class C family)
MQLKTYKRQVCMLCFVLILMQPLSAQIPHRRELARAVPEAVGVKSDDLKAVDKIIEEVVEKKNIPGATLIIGKGRSIIWRKAYGNRVLGENPVKMTPAAMFDMASVSKPVSTAAAVMLCYDRGLCHPDDAVSAYLDEFDTDAKRSITIRHLLTHTSGLPPVVSIPRLKRNYGPGPQPLTYFDAVQRCRLRAKPGEKYIYSDVNFASLAYLVNVLTGESMDRFLKRELYRPLGMKVSGYYLNKKQLARTAPNEPPEKKPLIGYVHDPTARYIQDGKFCGGNAGLYSRIDDLAIFARMMLNGGTWKSRRYFSRQAIEWMTTRQTPIHARSMGWGVSDKQTMKSPGPLAIMHTGWTGTYMYVNFKHDTFVIYLTNRTHSKDDSDHKSKRLGDVMEAACKALGHEW